MDRHDVVFLVLFIILGFIAGCLVGNDIAQNDISISIERAYIAGEQDNYLGKNRQYRDCNDYVLRTFK